MDRTQGIHSIFPGAQPRRARTPGALLSVVLIGSFIAVPAAQPLAAQSTAEQSAVATAQLWRPLPRTTWQWQITGQVGAPAPGITMYDIDLQDAVPTARVVAVPGFGKVSWQRGANAGVIDRMHARGRVVICYLDSGAWEAYRPDARLFPRSVIGRGTGWSEERWLDIRPQSWRRFAPLIWARLDLARAIGCDGVEPDQNNPVGNQPGIPITLADERAWYLEVARQAHARSLSVGMKNGVEIMDATMARSFDWALVEECFKYDECERTAPFVAARKAVFATEYEGDVRRLCARARALSLSLIRKRLELDAWRVSC
ncbi:MAG: endo alpha-1,4 polygalactosaminidase [Mycobacteriales bacterium]